MCKCVSVCAGNSLCKYVNVHERVSQCALLLGKKGSGTLSIERGFIRRGNHYLEKKNLTSGSFVKSGWKVFRKIAFVQLD